MAVPFWDLEPQRRGDGEVRGGPATAGSSLSQAPDFSDAPPWRSHWIACGRQARHGAPVNFHIGGGDMSECQPPATDAGVAANYASFPVTFFLGNAKTIATLHRRRDLSPLPEAEPCLGRERPWAGCRSSSSHVDWMWKECARRARAPRVRTPAERSTSDAKIYGWLLV